MRNILYFLFVMALSLFAGGCHGKKEPTVAIEYGTVTDVDNNVYRTVKIGNQWWMAENLKVKHYRNGLAIAPVLGTDPDSSWANKKTGAYCKYFNDDNNAKQYGLLYNWYAAIDTGKIAPAGWHIPSDDEWKQLETHLGMSQADASGVNWRGGHEADKMKVASPQGWTQFQDIWSNNESGFSALAGSCRLFNGIWGDPGAGAMGFWWASSSHPNNDQAWYRYLDYKKTNVFRYYGPKTYGMSIRCVKD